VRRVSEDGNRQTDTDSWQGRQVSVTVGPVAHGGHCVARHEGRVIFVRHSLPGEVVIAKITEDHGGSFCRADAVRVLQPAEERVPPPCQHAHPGGCGGCDFQHVTLEGQRALKAAVVREQLSRLAGIQWPVTVQALDALDDSGLGWRRRIRYASGSDGQLGLRAHRSHQVVPIDTCPLGAPGVGDAAGLRSEWPALAEVEVAVDDDHQVAVLLHRQVPARPTQAGRRRGGAKANAAQPGRASRSRFSTEQVSGPELLAYTAAGRRFVTRPSAFWQTHPKAADAFIAAVLAGADLLPGQRALDLYAGAGLFTAALADAVTSSGRVLGLEGDARAVADAAHNLADLGWADVRAAPVTAESVAAAAAEAGELAAVVLDPPRTGAGREVLLSILATGCRAVVYVACDPAALARDVRTALDAGWQLANLQAFDAFPMTHHVECVATLRPAA
jgi:tRNA/tmRNA/rRNA uracil-C5-methylase (TrmA/RlmC/RlmD family)